MSDKPAERPQGQRPDQTVKVTKEQMIEILMRARQSVKPIVNREAANEIVSEDVLNFRMKLSY